MSIYAENVKKVKETVAQFPVEFGLRKFPGVTFTLSEGSSFVDDSGQVMLYTYARDEKGKWQAFAKGTVAELRSQLVLFQGS